MTARRRASTLGLTLALLASPTFALAEPSVWSRARDPEGARRADLIAQAETLYGQFVDFQLNQLQRDGQNLPKLILKEARKKLEEAHAETSRDLGVRYHYGQILEQVGDYKASIAVLETMANARTPAAQRSRLYASLAIDYAHLGRTDDEIRAYGEALKVETSPNERSRILANQAEAKMAQGDISAAVSDYRAGLALHVAPTTLWGLGVALDRSGDLEAALESIRLARTYDPNDREISGPGWFYAVEHDRFWYGALGHWSRARFTDQGAVRAEEFARATQNLAEYIASAPQDDRWIPLAKARLKQLERERSLASRGARGRGPSPKPALPPK